MKKLVNLEQEMIPLIWGFNFYFVFLIMFEFITKNM